MPSILDRIRLTRCEMELAHSKFEDNPNELNMVFYNTKLNIYRDLCSVAVERLERENPTVLEDTAM